MRFKPVPVLLLVFTIAVILPAHGQEPRRATQAKAPADWTALAANVAARVPELALSSTAVISPGKAYEGDRSTEAGLSAHFVLASNPARGTAPVSGGRGAAVYAFRLTVTTYGSPEQAVAGLDMSLRVRSVSSEKKEYKGLTIRSFERYAPGHTLFLVGPYLAEAQTRDSPSPELIEKFLDAVIAELRRFPVNN